MLSSMTKMTVVRAQTHAHTNLPSDSTLLSRIMGVAPGDAAIIAVDAFADRVLGAPIVMASSRLNGLGWAGREAHRFSFWPEVGRRLRGSPCSSLCEEERCT